MKYNFLLYHLLSASQSSQHSSILVVSRTSTRTSYGFKKYFLFRCPGKPVVLLIILTDYDSGLSVFVQKLYHQIISVLSEKETLGTKFAIFACQIGYNLKCSRSRFLWYFLGGKSFTGSLQQILLYFLGSKSQYTIITKN